MTPELISQYRKRYESVDTLQDMGFWTADDVHDDIHKFLNALEAALSQAEANRVDAERYRWLRKQDWFDGELCVLRNPKEVLRRGSALGADCPSRSRLDEAIDILTNAVKTKG